MPQIFWNSGCQLVSLNFQTSDLPMQLNQVNNNTFWQGFLVRIYTHGSTLAGPQFPVSSLYPSVYPLFCNGGNTVTQWHNITRANITGPGGGVMLLNMFCLCLARKSLTPCSTLFSLSVPPGFPEKDYTRSRVPGDTVSQSVNFGLIFVRLSLMIWHSFDTSEPLPQLWRPGEVRWGPVWESCTVQWCTVWGVHSTVHSYSVWADQHAGHSSQPASQTNKY